MTMLIAGFSIPCCALKQLIIPNNGSPRLSTLEADLVETLGSLRTAALEGNSTTIFSVTHTFDKEQNAILEKHGFLHLKTFRRCKGYYTSPNFVPKEQQEANLLFWWKELLPPYDAEKEKKEEKKVA